MDNKETDRDKQALPSSQNKEEAFIMKLKVALSYLCFDMVASLFSFMTSIFFREIKSRGSYHIPNSGPIIFVAAPHHNQFVDPLVLTKTCPRRIHFLIAQKSLKRKAIGFLAKAFGAIGVSRAQDYAVKGQGLIFLPDPREHPNLIQGEGTQFLSQFSSGSSIQLPNIEMSLEIASIISDTQLLLKKGIVEEPIMDALKTPCSYSNLPKLDHQCLYTQVFTHLKKGNCIGIFPEGGSHDRSELLPFKAGFCVMALGAKALYPELNVRLVPVGLSYFHADRFRSRAVIEYGAPITVPEELVEWYKQGGKMKREACEKLMEWVHAAVSNVTVTAPDYNTLMVIQAVRRLYRPKNRKLTLVQKLDLTRRLMKGYLEYKSDPRIKELEKKVLHYNQLLKYYGLQDHQVERTAIYGFRALGLLLYRLGMLCIMGLIALPGTLINIPIAIAASHISKKKAKEALAASNVKIEARDVLATWKLLVALILVPTMYSIYIVLSWLLVRFFLKLDRPWTWGVPLSMFLGLPYLSLIALKFGEVGADIYKSLAPLTFSILPSRWIPSQNLRQTRFELARDLNDIINELGPTMYSDFHQFFMKDTDVPPSHQIRSISSNGIRKMSSWVTSWLITPTSSSLDRWNSPKAPGSPSTRPVSPFPLKTSGRILHQTTVNERRCFPDVQKSSSHSEIPAK